MHNVLIPQGAECSFSFWDLYKAAFKRNATEAEKKRFYVLTQEKKNVKVKMWVEQAQWTSEDRIGSDGITYTAFSKSKFQNP